MWLVDNDIVIVIIYLHWWPLGGEFAHLSYEVGNAPDIYLKLKHCPTNYRSTTL